MIQKFNYSYLRGFIKERYKSNAAFAQALGIGTTALYDRLENRVPFTQKEIYTVLNENNLTMKDIDLYFFNS